MQADVYSATPYDNRVALFRIGLAILLSFSSLIAAPVNAAQVAFAWDYDASGAAGFVLYCGPSINNYPIHVDVGNTTAATISGLAEGSTYACAVTAYDAAKVESAYSNVVDVSIPYAPPTINFAANPSTGNAPLSVAFANTTTGTVTGWAWSFGDGTTSTAQSPTHVYSQPGSYTVSLTATGPGGSATQTSATEIKVNAPPTAAPTPNFTVSPTTGTAPLSVGFTNTSTGTVTSWAWSFGDGATSTAQSPTHAYTQAGTYTVSLTATGPGGSVTKTLTAAIKVNAPPSPAPTPSFAVSPATGTAPLSVGFTNTSTGTVTSWAWTFGDGATSTAQSPTHAYTQAGTYTVSLTATGPGGSVTKTLTAAIKVNAPPSPAPTPSFAVSPATGTAPLSVGFTNTSTGTVTSWAWSFGDGATSTAQSPTHAYTQAGTYTVSLTATGPGGSVTKTLTGAIQVNAPPSPPVLKWTRTVTGTTAPVTIAFNNLSTGVVDSWLWDFGDGTTSNLKSPTHVYTKPGVYTFKLTARGPGGTVSKSAATPVSVLQPAPPPVLNWTRTVTGTTAPVTIAFNNLSTGAVDSWLWDFGDGTTSNLKSPTHVYTKPGVYTFKLTARGPGGTVSKSAATPISVLQPAPPVLNWTRTVTGTTAPVTIAFNNLSTGAVDSWLWDFGDGVTSNLKSPTHVYTKPGVYTFKLTARGPGGTVSKSAATPISVLKPAPPVLDWTRTVTGTTAPVTIAFNNLSTGAVDSWLWDFGDGVTSNLKSPTHVYTKPGVYTFKLTARGPGGTVSRAARTPIKVNAL